MTKTSKVARGYKVAGGLASAVACGVLLCAASAQAGENRPTPPAHAPAIPANDTHRAEHPSSAKPGVGGSLRETWSTLRTHLTKPEPLRGADRNVRLGESLVMLARMNEHQGNLEGAAVKYDDAATQYREASRTVHELGQSERAAQHSAKADELRAKAQEAKAALAKGTTRAASDYADGAAAWGRVGREYAARGNLAGAKSAYYASAEHYRQAAERYRSVNDEPSAKQMDARAAVAVAKAQHLFVKG